MTRQRLQPSGQAPEKGFPSGGMKAPTSPLLMGSTPSPLEPGKLIYGERDRGKARHLYWENGTPSPDLQFSGMGNKWVPTTQGLFGLFSLAKGPKAEPFKAFVKVSLMLTQSRSEGQSQLRTKTDSTLTRQCGGFLQPSFPARPHFPRLCLWRPLATHP